MMKIDCQTVTITTSIYTVEAGEIPDNLSELTMSILLLHRANGDLGWVEDMLREVNSHCATVGRVG